MKKSLLLALPAFVLLASCGDKKLNTEKTVEELNNTIQNVTSGEVILVEGSINVLEDNIKFELAVENKTGNTYTKVISNDTDELGSYTVTTTTITNLDKENNTCLEYTKHEYVYENPDNNTTDESWMNMEYEESSIGDLKNSITVENFEKYGLAVDNKSKNACVTSVKKDGVLVINIDASKLDLKKLLENNSTEDEDNQILEMINQLANAITLSGNINVSVTNDVIEAKTESFSVSVDPSKVDPSQGSMTVSISIDLYAKVSKSSDVSYFVIPAEKNN